MAAPATPLIKAKTVLASTCKMADNACATAGDAKNARNPIANPTAPKIASIPVRDTIYITADFRYLRFGSFQMELMGIYHSSSALQLQMLPSLSDRCRCRNPY